MYVMYMYMYACICVFVDMYYIRTDDQYVRMLRTFSLLIHQVHTYVRMYEHIHIWYMYIHTNMYVMFSMCCTC